MLEIISPVTLISGSVSVLIDSVALGLVISPVAVIDITLRVIKFPFSVRFVVLPLPFVFCAIGPNLHTVAVAVQTLPFSGKHSPILKSEGFVVDRCVCDVKFTLRAVDVDAVVSFVHMRMRHLLVIEAHITL